MIVQYKMTSFAINFNIIIFNYLQAFMAALLLFDRFILVFCIFIHLIQFILKKEIQNFVNLNFQRKKKYFYVRNIYNKYYYCGLRLHYYVFWYKTTFKKLDDGTFALILLLAYKWLIWMNFIND